MNRTSNTNTSLLRPDRGYWQYLAAVVMVAVTVLTRDYYFRSQFPFLPLMVAVMLAASLGGFWAGVLAIALSLAASWHWIVEDFTAESSVGLVRIRPLIFTCFGLLASYLIGSWRVGKQRLEERRAQLEMQQLQLEREISRRAEAELALREREERVRMAVESADIGTWDLNPITGERNWSARTKVIFGLQPDEEVTNVSFLDRVHPDDYERATSAVQQAVDPGGNGRYEIDCRVIWPDGSIHWCIAKGQAFFGEHQGARRMVRFIGTVIEITDRKLAEERLTKQHEMLTLAQSIGRIGHWEWNSATDSNNWSPQIEALYGLAPGGFEGGYGGWSKLLHPDDRDKAAEDVRRAFETGEYNSEFRVVWPDGSIRWLETRAKVIHDGAEGARRIVGVNMDVTPRKRLEQELRSLNAELAETDRRKDEFLATLAHELRNPLTPISNALQIWDSVGEDSVKMEQLRSMMNRQVAQMIRLIDDLMDVSRITRGRITLRKERVDLAAVVTSAVESVQSLVDAGNHRLTVTMPAERQFVDGDPARLMQILGNVLNNAAKFTPRGGDITVRVQKNERQAVVTIRDNGRGIPPEMLGDIFETFRQVDQTLERAQNGLGIGLTLAKRLTELHSGTIEARSDGVGKGSEFIITLPTIAETSNGLATGDWDAGHRAGDIPRRLVLIVDDLPEVAESFRTMLEVLGQEVLIAYDGRSAIELALARRPQFIFLDIGMPELNGYDVARRLRASAELTGVTLIALTGYAQDTDQSRAREAGFDHHLAKPTDLKLLREILTPSPESAGTKPRPWLAG